MFSEGLRTDRTPSRHNEDLYSFLDRSAVPFFKAVRDLIEAWVSRVPGDHRAQLVGSLRSRSREEFESAFWELYLHEAYTSSGHTVTIHPALPHSSSRPDFLIESEATRFYLEAVRVGRSVSLVAEEKRLDEVHVAINSLPVGRFMVDVTTYAIGPRPLATRGLRNRLQAWLAGLDPQEVARTASSSAGFGGLPRFDLRHDGWHLAFYALPLKSEAISVRGLVGTLGPGEAHVVDNISGFARALRTKSLKYGPLNDQLVVAVLSNTEIPTKDYEVEQVLFGVSSRRPVEASERPEDLFRDGHWLSRAGWRRGHAPRVISMQGLNPWDVTKVQPRLWSTLEPGVTLPAQPPWLAEVDVAGVEAQVGPAAGLNELFGLPKDWLSRGPEWDISGG